MLQTPVYNETFQILIGLETLYPDRPIFSRLRFLLESLVQSSQKSTKTDSDVLMLIKSIGEFPLTDHIERLLQADGAEQLLSGALRVMNHLSYDATFENFKLMMSHFSFDENNAKALQPLIIKWLNEKSLEPGFDYAEDLSSLLQEKSSLVSAKKLFNLYGSIYDEPSFNQLFKGIEHLLKLEDDGQLFKFLETQTDLPLVRTIRRLRQEKLASDLPSAFSKGQVKSKLWAIKKLQQNLDKPLDSVLLVCGWYSILTYLMSERLDHPFTRVRSLDSDPSCELIAEEFNKDLLKDNWRFKATTADAYSVVYANPHWDLMTLVPLKNSEGKEWHEATTYDLIINTSCEHLKEFGSWYEKLRQGQLVLLQSNDYFTHQQHVNCVKSLEEFKQMAPLSEIIYEGMLPLPKYNRFMLIGYK